MQLIYSVFWCGGLEFVLKEFLISVNGDQENDITWSYLLTMEKEDLEKVTLQ